MDTPEKPKKNQPLIGVGLTLLIGGFCVLRFAGKAEAFYQNNGEEGSVSWAVGLGWLLIIGGCGLLLGGVAKHFTGKG